MKKFFLLSLFLLFIPACQTDKCKTVSMNLTDKIATTFECSNRDYLYNKISYFCNKENSVKSEYPQSFVGNMACKLCVGYIANSINEFSTNAKCKKPFVSESFKQITTDVCSVIVP